MFFVGFCVSTFGLATFSQKDTWTRHHGRQSIGKLLGPAKSARWYGRFNLRVPESRISPLWTMFCVDDRCCWESQIRYACEISSHRNTKRPFMYSLSTCTDAQWCSLPLGKSSTMKTQVAAYYHQVQLRTWCSQYVHDGSCTKRRSY